MINYRNRPRFGPPADGAAPQGESRAAHLLQDQASMATVLLRSITDRPVSSSPAQRRNLMELHANLQREVSATVRSAQRLVSSPVLTPRAASDLAHAMSMLNKASAEEVRLHGDRASVLPRSLRQSLNAVSQQFEQRVSGAHVGQAAKMRRSDRQYRLNEQAGDTITMKHRPASGGYEQLSSQELRGARGLPPKKSPGSDGAGGTTWNKMVAKIGHVGRKIVGKTKVDQPLITPFVQEPPTQVKTKRSYFEYAHLPFASGRPEQRYSRITAKSGRDYVMTWTQRKGGFGKLRWGFTPAGKSVAIKEVRHTPKQGVDKMGRPKTHAVRPEDAVAEARMTVNLRRSIERYTSFWDKLPHNEPGSFKNLRAGIKPFEVHDTIVDDTTAQLKTYIVMSRETGDLLQLRDNLQGKNGGIAAISLAAQGFTELAGLHEEVRYMHGDLRLENIFFNELGQMKLMDFGLAEALNAQGVTSKQGMRGSIMAPESVGFGYAGGGYPFLTSATDVFAMAVVVAEMAQHPNLDIMNPFHTGFLLPGFNPDRADASYAQVFAMFEYWKSGYTGINGRIDVRRIDGSKSNMFDIFFAGLARSSPALCDIVLNDAMAADVSRRLPAKALAQRARGLAKPVGRQLAQLQQSMAAMEKDNPAETFRQAALGYDAFDKQADARRLETGRRKYRDLAW